MRKSWVKSESATQMRRMSAPYWFITSWGATVLPSDFDIFWPFSSRAKPWVSTHL